MESKSFPILLSALLTFGAACSASHPSSDEPSSQAVIVEKDAGSDGAASDAGSDAATPVDPCWNAPFIGYYCGESFEDQFGIQGGERGYLYFCGVIDGDPDHAQTTSKVKCDLGCFQAPPGVNDRCR